MESIGGDWRTGTRHLWAALLLVLVTAICFLPGLTPSLSGDDFVHVYKNRIPFPGAFRVFTEADGREFRPLVRFSLSTDHLIWGSDYRGFHLTNLLLHLAAVLLVFRIALLLLPDFRAPFAAAVLFALHPVHSYSVNAVMGRTDLLCALFLVGAALACVRTKWVLTALLFAAALLSKEVAIAFPLVLLLWFLTSSSEQRRAQAIPLVVIWVLAAAYLGLRLTLLSPREADLAVYLQFSAVHILRNIAYYGGAFLVPAGQFQLRALAEAQPLPASLLGLAAAAAAAGVAWRTRHEWLRSRTVWMAAAWAVAFLLPVILLFQRRFLYIPSIGFCLLLAWLFQRFGRPAVWWIVVFITVGFAALSLNASLTWREAGRQVDQYLESLTPIVAAHLNDRIYVANVPNGLGEAHLFTHDSLRFAVGLRTGRLPDLVPLTRIQVRPGGSWITELEPKMVKTKIDPGPETYFVFDAPELLPRGGRFLPVGTRFQEGPFGIEVAAADRDGRVAELVVDWNTIPDSSMLLVFQPDSRLEALGNGPESGMQRPSLGASAHGAVDDRR